MSAPLWSRTADADGYGGHPLKRDYGMTGCVNALTDVSAEQIKRLASDAVAIARTCPLWGGTITRSGSAFTVAYSRPMWADHVRTYSGSAAPTGHPSVALTGANQVTITFPVSAVDEYGTSGNISILAAFPMLAGVTWTGVAGGNAIILTGFTDSSVVPVQVY